MKNSNQRRIKRRTIILVMFFSGALAGLAGMSEIAGLHHRLQPDFSPGYGYIIFGGAIIGVAAGAFMSSNWALATDLIARGEEARYLGLTNMATAGGAALARLIGPVIDFFNNYTSGLGYQVMLGACFFYFVTGSILLLKIKGKRRS